MPLSPQTTDDPRIGTLLRTKDDYRDAAVTLKVLAKALLGDHSGAVDMGFIQYS